MITCPFCHPSIKEAVFYESTHFMAIYNVAPVFPGHAMIIPKAHITGLLIIPEEEIVEMVKLSRIVVRILQKAFHARGFNWSIQEGEEAGQTIKHLHMHIIPRKPQDLEHPGDWYPLLKKFYIENIDSELRPKISADEMKRIVSKLKEVAGTLDTPL
jgi:bis(5'-adenosyl)-triphosphatase